MCVCITDYSRALDIRQNKKNKQNTVTLFMKNRCPLPKLSVHSPQKQASKQANMSYNSTMYLITFFIVLCLDNVQSFTAVKNTVGLRMPMVIQEKGCCSTLREHYSCCHGKSFSNNKSIAISSSSSSSSSSPSSCLFMANIEDDGVVELVEEVSNNKNNKASEIQQDNSSSPRSVSAAPFLSQGEISEEAMNPDFTDPKQTRVIIYIVLSLLPVLFLIPLMLGSRDLIPLDALPPVQM